MTLEEKLTDAAKTYCDRSQGNWRFGRYIAEGNSAAVFRIDSLDGPAALKIYDPIFFEGKEGEKSLHRVNAHKELIGHDCSDLIGILDAGPFDDTAFVLMEFLPWKELAELVPSFPPDKIGLIINQLSSAALFLDQQGICHRDIKPENIALSDDYKEMKLLDLGILRSTTNEEGAGSDNDGRRPFIGTVQYSPPEYLLREESGAEGYRALTYYQIGAVLHDLIMLEPIFAEEKMTGNKHILHEAVRHKIPTIASDLVEKRFITLARDCLEKDPKRRMELVDWNRFNKEHEQSIELEAAKARYGLKSTLAGSGGDNVSNEGHKLKLVNVTKALTECISNIRRDKNLPPLMKDTSKIDYEHSEPIYIFSHIEHVSKPVEIIILFELHAPLGSDHCVLNLDCREQGRGQKAIGRISITNPVHDLDILKEEIANKLIEEYIAQLEDAEINEAHK